MPTFDTIVYDVHGTHTENRLTGKGSIISPYISTLVEHGTNFFNFFYTGLVQL